MILCRPENQPEEAAACRLIRRQCRLRSGRARQTVSRVRGLNTLTVNLRHKGIIDFYLEVSQGRDRRLIGNDEKRPKG